MALNSERELSARSARLGALCAALRKPVPAVRWRSQRLLRYQGGAWPGPQH
jgi:hypothetical protein